MRFAALLCALLALGACEKEKQYDGIGSWHISKSKLKDHGGATCQMDEGGVNWCPTYEKIDLGGQQASLDLYFDGKEDDAPLVEILLAVNRCQASPLGRALRKKLGDPKEDRGAVKVWSQEEAVIVATLPREDGTCEVSFLGPKQKERIAELKARAGR